MSNLPSSTYRGRVLTATARVGDLLVPLADGSRDQRDLLGGKGANLAELVRMGIPVPPGFVITTDAYREYVESGSLPPALVEALPGAMHSLGGRLGRRFGSPDNPLLVSVRSGAPVSMPGMMDTILNVGLGPGTIDGFVAGSGAGRAFGADCLRRLREMFAASVDGGSLPEDPWEQLRVAVTAVFESWNSSRAQVYRRFHQIADSGTAVVVQAMVFGNGDAHSGTGVLFTRDPSSGAARLYGDYLACAQGEDVVAGTTNTEDLEGLRARVPSAHAELVETAAAVERHFGDMCEIEFTIERGRLWLLQTRTGQRSARAAVVVATQLADEGAISRETAVRRVDPGAIAELLQPRLDADALRVDDVLATAVGASPGIAIGTLALDTRSAIERASRGERVVLARPETSPDDLEGIIASAGLLTLRGGKTSHAAVVARGLGRPCVCGADEQLEIDVPSGELRARGVTLQEGDLVSIDGESGRVVRGRAPIQRTDPPPELARLLSWADELRSLRVEAVVTSADEARDAIARGADAVVVRAALHAQEELTAAVGAAGDRVVGVWIDPGGEASPADADVRAALGPIVGDRPLLVAADAPDEPLAWAGPPRAYAADPDAAALTRLGAAGIEGVLVPVARVAPARLAAAHAALELGP